MSDEELSSVEKEEKMPYVTSVERIGFKRGIIEGEKVGQANLLARQIARKFRSTVTKESLGLKKLDTKALTRLGEKLLYFETLDEVHDWIEKYAEKKAV